MHWSLGMAVVFGVFFLIVAVAKALWIFKEGKLNLTQTRAVYGTPAYVIAILLLLYVPTSIGIIYLINATGGGVVNHGNKDLVSAGVVQVGVLVLLAFLLVSAFIAAICSEHDAGVWRPRKRRPQREERRPRGRRMRHDEIEELEEERAQRRYARRQPVVDDEDDEEDNRRRRRRD
jgi:hypothetical protein